MSCVAEGDRRYWRNKWCLASVSIRELFALIPIYPPTSSVPSRTFPCGHGFKGGCLQPSPRAVVLVDLNQRWCPRPLAHDWFSYGPGTPLCSMRHRRGGWNLGETQEDGLLKTSACSEPGIAPGAGAAIQSWFRWGTSQ